MKTKNKEIIAIIGLVALLSIGSIIIVSAIADPYPLDGYVLYPNGTKVGVGANITFTNQNTTEVIYDDTSASGWYSADAGNFPSGYQDGHIIKYETVYSVYINTTYHTVDVVGASNTMNITLDAQTGGITELTNGTPSYTSVLITWQSNQTSNNRVLYGQNASLLDGVWSGWQNGTEDVSITLDGLNTSSTYYYQAWSHSSQSCSEPATEPYKNFTTKTPTVPDITSLTNTEPTTSTVTVMWTTNQSDSNNRVRYGKLSNLSDGVFSGWQNNTGSVSIQLSGLDKNTTYYYQACTHNSYTYNLSDTEPASEPYESFVTLVEQTTLDKFTDTTKTSIALMGVLAIVVLAALIIGVLVNIQSGAEIDWKLIMIGAVTLVAFMVVLFVGISIFSAFT